MRDFLLIFLACCCGLCFVRAEKIIDTTQTKLVNMSGLSFYTALVHYNWCTINEKHVMDVLQSSIETLHKLEPKKECTMVDVGMNDGFYTNMAASLGCTVWSFEIQERCIALSYNAVYQNKFEDKVTIVHRPVSNKHNEPISIVYSARAECSGMFNLGRGDFPTQFQPTEADTMNKTFVALALSHFFPKHFLLDFLKIDVEGFDPQVLEGAEHFFRTKRIKMAVIEAQPKMWSKLAPGVPQHEKIYERIMSYGYSVECLKTDAPDISKTWPIFTIENYNDFLAKLLTSLCIDWKFFLPELSPKSATHVARIRRRV